MKVLDVINQSGKISRVHNDASIADRYGPSVIALTTPPHRPEIDNMIKTIFIALSHVFNVTKHMYLIIKPFAFLETCRNKNTTECD